MTSRPYLPAAATQGPSSPPSRVQWWRMPFTADTWRRTTYVLLAPPLSIIAVPVALLGGHRVTARWRCGLVQRWLGLRVDRPTTAARVATHALLSLPLDLASLALVAYLWTGVLVNLAYPLRPGTMQSYQHSWGGPTLTGAWAVHAAGGLGFLLLTPWVVRAATRLQGRLVLRLLGRG
jgi:hypothetical protein